MTRLILEHARTTATPTMRLGAPMITDKIGPHHLERGAIPVRRGAARLRPSFETARDCVVAGRHADAPRFWAKPNLTEWLLNGGIPMPVDKKDGKRAHKRREDAAAPSNLKQKRPIPAILSDEREFAFTSQMNPPGPRNPL
jgi:hypothetical protein